MAPSLVLLDSFVPLCFEEEDDEAAAVAAEECKGAVAAARTPQSRTDAAISFLGSLTPDALLHRAPKISTLRLRSSRPVRDLARLQIRPYALVACADKSMLVLYGGDYQGPGTPERGCYLVYDAAVSGGSTLTSTVPPLPLSSYIMGIGASPVVLRNHPSSSYVLVELATTLEVDLPDAVLYLWRSDSPTPQWEMRTVTLPPEVSSAPGETHFFSIDTSFSFGTSGVCWVDLLRGIVLYHHGDQQFRFIPLPDGCPEFGFSRYRYRPRMPEFRTAACVSGVIKLVALEGYLEDWDWQQFRFVTWTLTSDLRQWKKGGEFHLKDIWASYEYLALKVPQVTPLCPVLSPVDDDVIYVVLNHVDMSNIVQGSEVVETKVDIHGQYVLGLDIMSNRIISADSGRPASSVKDFTPTLFATDFCPCLLSPKDRQREEKASEVAESGKRLKVY